MGDTGSDPRSAPEMSVVHRGVHCSRNRDRNLGVDCGISSAGTDSCMCGVVLCSFSEGGPLCDKAVDDDLKCGMRNTECGIRVVTIF